MINSSHNHLGGVNLNAMYNRDGTQHKDPYLVFAQPYFPLSFYVTRQGKFKLF